MDVVNILVKKRIMQNRALKVQSVAERDLLADGIGPLYLHQEQVFSMEAAMFCF